MNALGASIQSPTMVSPDTIEKGKLATTSAKLELNLGWARCNLPRLLSDLHLPTSSSSMIAGGLP